MPALQTHWKPSKIGEFYFKTTSNTTKVLKNEQKREKNQSKGILARSDFRYVVKFFSPTIFKNRSCWFYTRPLTYLGTYVNP